jgi:indole-3-glycerol phosphate synthase
MTGNLLGTAVAAARRSALERERGRPVPSPEPASGRVSNGQRFVSALSAPGARIIAECKRRSPSRGVLRPDYDPVALASDYERHGAAAISVLTEATFFDGALEHLAGVRAAVGVPLLRKDFIVTEYQIAEAQAAGADAVLLIVAAVSQAELVALLRCSAGLGLSALVEVHDAAELDRALTAGAEVVGVNSRNLRTLEVDPAAFERLAPAIPAGIVAVAESGLKTATDIRRLAALRYDAFLIGERLVTEARPGAALEELVEAVRGA